MIIHSSSIFAAPLMLLIWTADVFVFLACMRLLLGRITGEWANRVAAGLGPIVDPAAQAAARTLNARRQRPVPGWVPWICVMAFAITIRYVLLWVVVCCMS